MLKPNKIDWTPLKERYTESELPAGYRYYVIGLGHTGIVVLNFLQEARTQEPIFYVGITTSQGTIPAIWLGIRSIAIVEWHEETQLEQEGGEDEG